MAHLMDPRVRSARGARLLAPLLGITRDWFLVGIFGAVALASAFPEVGRSGGPAHGDVLADAGIFWIFLVHGIALSPGHVRAGVARWQLHVFVQLTTFAVFPLAGLLLGLLLARWAPAELVLGFAYLCALPSTLSSSVAMTAIARGNVPGAIFNATISSLLGVVLTPLLVGFATHAAGQALPLGTASLNIAKLLLVPLLLGQCLRPMLGSWFHRQARHASAVDKVVILLLVYVSFCDSVRGGLWTDHGLGTLGLTVAASGTLLVALLLLTTFGARWSRFPKEDEIAAVFCGSKKSLAAGVAMAKLIFGSRPTLGLLLLPVIFYHQLQLLVCAVLASRYARRATDLVPECRAAP